ncbi:MAG: Holliday junction resolvase RuvX [Flavobacteriaceae bacterium]
MERILGLDIGSVRTGIATAYMGLGVASSLETVESKQLIERLIQLNKEEKISLIVVGKATQMDGTPSESMRFIEDMANKLEKSGFKIVWQDERFTSKLASKSIAQSGMSKKKRQDKTLIDRVSATILLQSYLERIL